jgi:hypothetical protein
MLNIRKTLIAAACAVAFTSSVSAAVVTDAFDGAWTKIGGDENKGLMVDYIPSINLVFGAFFTYANDGSQVWSVFTVNLVDGQLDYSNVDILKYTGGQFSAVGTPTSQVIGKAEVSFACDVITMDITPANGSNITPANFVFQPSLGLKKMTTGECNEPITTCPEGTTAEGSACLLPASITNDLFLPAGKDYVVKGRVSVEAGGTLNIAPGVTVIGSTDRTNPNFISVKKGAQIYANGTPDQPITFTGPEAVPGSWAGIVIAGNSICNDGTEAQSCQFEAVPDITYGSTTPVLDDNSGSLRYVRIRWAGQQIAPNEASSTLSPYSASATGTVLEHVQVDGGKDDGIEIFGGSASTAATSSARTWATTASTSTRATPASSSSLLGLPGRATPIWATTRTASNPTTTAATTTSCRAPSRRSRTSRWSGKWCSTRHGMRLRRGTGGNYTNVVVTGFRDRCLNLIDAGTYAQGTGSAQGATLSMTHSFVGNCAGGQFEDNASAAYAVSAWYNVGTGNGADAALTLTGFLPAANAAYLTGGKANEAAWFFPANYRGAFAGPRDNWTAGWTVNLPN